MPTPRDAAYKIRQRELEEHVRIERRQHLYRNALNAAVLSDRRFEFEKRLALKQGIPAEFWPEMLPLDPAEVTAILREIRKIFGLRAED